MNRNTALSALIAIATLCTTLASAGDTVYVSARNGAAYHSADCPRLRFAKELSLNEASRRYRPCPVCQGKASDPTPLAAVPVSSRELAAVAEPVLEPIAEPAAISLPEVAPTPPSPERPVAVRPAPSRRGGGKARWILAAVGGAAGFVGGAAIGINECLLGCEDEAKYNTILAVLTLGGAVGGYALGYALTDHSASVDQALDRDRAAIRRAHAERRHPEEAASLVGHRTTP